MLMSGKVRILAIYLAIGGIFNLVSCVTVTVYLLISKKKVYYNNK